MVGGKRAKGVKTMKEEKAKRHLKPKLISPFSGKQLTFSIGRYKDLLKMKDKEDLIEVDKIFLDKETGRLYFIMKDNAYPDKIKFIDIS